MKTNHSLVSRPGRQVAWGSLFGLLVAAPLFLFLPLTLYIGNYGEFTISFSALVQAYWQFPIFVIALLALIAMLLPRTSYLAYSSFLAMLSILIWTQGNLLVWEYGLFDGSGIDWSANRWRGWIEIGIWAVALLVSVAAYQRLRRPLLQLAIALLVVSLINPKVMALSVPLLAIKRPGETGLLEVNRAPTWIVDTAATIADIAGWEDSFNGTSVFSLDENAPRKRRWYYYKYKRSEWAADYLSPIDEYLIDGSVFDSASWHYGITYFPGGEVRVVPGK